MFLHLEFNIVHDCFNCFLRGFTKFNRTDYLKFKSENRIVPDGVNAKVM